MGTQIFKIKRNDTLPALKINIITKSRLGGKEGYDMNEVTGATFSMVKEDCGEMKIHSQPAQIICSSGGTLQYNWQHGDTNTSGFYGGEFELNYSDGNRMSVPVIGGIKIEILDDLNSFNSN